MFLRLAINALTTTAVRYLIVAGGFYLVFWVWKRERWSHLRIQAEQPKKRFLWLELCWSASTIVIWSAMSAAMLMAYHAGRTRIYLDIQERGWPYFFASIVAMIAIADAYFYFTHRLLHWKPLFRRVHRVHHLSKNPTPFSTFSFHPVEAFIQWWSFGIPVFLVPCHPYALAVFLFFTTMTNTVGHLGYEMYPRGFTRNRLTRWLNHSTFHNLHHSRVSCNYGLYFNAWDALFGTNWPGNSEFFEALRARRPERERALTSPSSPSR